MCSVERPRFIFGIGVVHVVYPRNHKITVLLYRSLINIYNIYICIYDVHIYIYICIYMHSIRTYLITFVLNLTAYLDQSMV